MSTVATNKKFRPDVFEARSFITDINREDYKLQPNWQRGYVHDEKKRVALIESILLGFPIGEITIGEDAEGYTIVDGQQRITTIRDFISNTSFVLSMSKDVKTQYKELYETCNGKTFHELPDNKRESIERYKIRAIIIKFDTLAEKLDAFKRMNTGSVHLNADECRNAAFPGKFMELTKRLALLPASVKLFGEKKTKRLISSTMIQRLFYLLDRGAVAFKPKERADFNEYIGLMNNASQESIDAKEEYFENTINRCLQIFEKNAFASAASSSKKAFGESANSSNFGIFMLLMEGLCSQDVAPSEYTSNQTLLRSELNKLKNEQDFIDATSSKGSGYYKAENIAARRDLWERLLKSANVMKRGVRLSPAKAAKQKQEIWDSKEVHICTCGLPINSLEESHLDHINPFSKGGGEDITNKQLLHVRCNLTKSNSALV